MMMNKRQVLCLTLEKQSPEESPVRRVRMKERRAAWTQKMVGMGEGSYNPKLDGLEEYLALHPTLG